MSKDKTKKSGLTPRSLRIILIVLMLFIVAGSWVGITIGLQTIKSHAIEVSHSKIDADASNGNIQALQKTEDYLNTNQDVLDKVGLLRADSQFPEFKVVDEIQKIAAENNIQIDSFNYGTDATKSETSSTTPSTAPPASSTPTSSDKTVALTVTFKAPSYLAFLQFTYDIEQHLPKMKVKGISASSSTGTDLTIEPITVEMYIK